MWVLQLYYFFEVVLLCGAPSISIWFLGLAFFISAKRPLGFWWGCIKSVNYLGGLPSWQCCIVHDDLRCLPVTQTFFNFYQHFMVYTCKSFTSFIRCALLNVLLNPACCYFVDFCLTFIRKVYWSVVFWWCLYLTLGARECWSHRVS